MSSKRLTGEFVSLRLATVADVPALVAIRATPEVRSRWRGDELEQDIRDSISEEDLDFLVIEDGERRVIGAIQWEAEDEPDYRHAGVDMFLDPEVHNRGYGADAVRTLCRHLFDVEGHHRITIDPAADNHAAIHCYENVGFKQVGVMRQYERGNDGTYHDGLLMDLLRGDLT